MKTFSYYNYPLPMKTRMFNIDFSNHYRARLVRKPEVSHFLKIQIISAHTLKQELRNYMCLLSQKTSRKCGFLWISIHNKLLKKI